MTRIAIYPGSFDPPTKGHEDLIRRSLALADRVIVAVAVNPSKQPLFPVEERLAMLRATVGDDPRVSFESFDGLLAEFAKQGGRLDGGARPARGQRLRIRVPDGPDEPPAASRRWRRSSWCRRSTSPT